MNIPTTATTKRKEDTKQPIRLGRLDRAAATSYPPIPFRNTGMANINRIYNPTWVLLATFPSIKDTAITRFPSFHETTFADVDMPAMDAEPCDSPGLADTSEM